MRRPESFGLDPEGLINSLSRDQRRIEATRERVREVFEKYFKTHEVRLSAMLRSAALWKQNWREREKETLRLLADRYHAETPSKGPSVADLLVGEAGKERDLTPQSFLVALGLCSLWRSSGPKRPQTAMTQLKLHGSTPLTPLLNPACNRSLENWRPKMLNLENMLQSNEFLATTMIYNFKDQDVSSRQCYYCCCSSSCCCSSPAPSSASCCLRVLVARL